MFLRHPIKKKSDFDLNSINCPTLVCTVTVSSEEGPRDRGPRHAYSVSVSELGERHGWLLARSYSLPRLALLLLNDLMYRTVAWQCRVPKQTVLQAINDIK